MKRYKLILSMLGLGIALTSCEDKLDLEPTQSISTEAALSTGDNIENLLIGAYAEAGQAASYGGRLQMMADLYGATDQVSWNGTFQQPRQVYVKNVLVDNSYVSGFWLNAYDVINQTNIVIDNLAIVDEDNQANIEGQARFLRGLTYFDLTRMFGQQYMPGQANDQLGVPLSLDGIVDYSGNLEIARATVGENYAQVIEDLETAYDLLPEGNSEYAGKYAAQALLARVYLQQGDYAAALAAANDVIENGGFSLTGDFADAFNNDTDGPETIFAFQVTTQDGSNTLITHYADQSNGGRGNDISINDEYVAMFDSEDDVRGEFFYESAQSGDRLTSKYTNQFGNVTVLRLAEMYLIRAEANLELNSSTGSSPLEDVNTVRLRSGADALSSVSLEDVWMERQLELAFEGFFIHDLKRTMQDVGDISYDDNSLVFPIPQREMDVNSLLSQNPGYGS